MSRDVLSETTAIRHMEKLKRDRSLAGFIPAALTGSVFYLFLVFLGVAAHPVEDTTNGFTDRPFPGGTLQATRTGILSFADFVFVNPLAWPYPEEDRVVLVPLNSTSRSATFTSCLHRTIPTEPALSWGLTER